MIYTLQYVASYDLFISSTASFQFNSVGRTSPAAVTVLFLKSDHVDSFTGQVLFVLSIVRGLACLYTIWLIYVKIKYRQVLENHTISIGRDVCQLLLSVIPLLILVSHPIDTSVNEIVKNDVTDYEIHREAYI